MISISIRALLTGVLAVALVAGADAARAQSPSSGGLLDRIFGSDRKPGTPPGQVAQTDPSSLLVRIDRLETQIRRLTGVVEQLQFQNQQLTEQLKRMQADTEFRFQELGSKGKPHRQRPRTSPPASPTAPAAVPGKRSDVFDPLKHPDAPGAPKTLGGPKTLGAPNTPGAVTGPTVIGADPDPQNGDNAPPIGAPGGRNAGAPLDLSKLAEIVSNNPAPASSANRPAVPPGSLPPPPPRNTSGTGARIAAVQPPSQSPKDLYDVAYGYVLHKDYALAENTFRNFIKTYPSDRLTPDAQYWLGESMFQRQRYRDAAEAFLTVSTKYETTGKAPDALLRLGQSLAALGEKEAACAALAEVRRKFPRASTSVKRGVAREQKRAHC